MLSCRAQVFKRRPGQSGQADTHRAEQLLRTTRDKQAAKQTAATMKATITTIALLVLALGMTSEAVQVEVSFSFYVA